MPTVPDVRVGVQGNCHWRTDADDGEVGGLMSELTRGGGGTNDRVDAGACICRRRQSSPADSVVPDASCKLYTRQPDAQWHQNLWHDRPHPIDVIDGMDGLCYRLQEIIFCNIFFCGAAIGDLAIICGVFRPVGQTPAFFFTTKSQSSVFMTYDCRPSSPWRAHNIIILPLCRQPKVVFLKRTLW